MKMTNSDRCIVAANLAIAYEVRRARKPNELPDATMDNVAKRFAGFLARLTITEINPAPPEGQ